MLLNKYLSITLTLLCLSNTALAASVTSCETKSTNNPGEAYDYGDATGYGEACHDTNRWQQLGYSKDKNRDDIALSSGTGDNDDGTPNRGWNQETEQNNVDKGDNGVRWRVQDENGNWINNWGRAEFTQGQLVEFQFFVERNKYGNHEFDQLKAWVDWNGDGTFQDDGSETLIDRKWYKVADNFEAGNTVGNQDGGSNNDTLVTSLHGSVKNSDINRARVSVVKQIPYDAALENVWLRARVICENSLHEDDRLSNTFLPTGYYHQGEAEDYKLAIVPEPTTLLMFSTAMFALMLRRNKIS